MTENVFFNLLRSSLWGTPASIPSDLNDWSGVFSLAKSQSVLGLIAHAVLNDPAIVASLPEGLSVKLRSFMMANVATHNLLNNTLLQVVSTLDNAGVRSVLLKGQGLARVYPVPELRACGDIDIYVGSENYLKSCDVLGNIASWKEDSQPAENTKHFDIRIGKTTVEIHRYSDVNASKRYDRIYQTYSDEGLSSKLRVMDFAGTTVNTPADDFNAFYIFNHIWHHFMTSGIGLRQLCDWMLFLHARKDDIDQAKLRKILDDMDMMKPWQAFGCVLVDKMGMPAEEFPFYEARRGKKVRKIVDRILTEGNFGQEREFFKNRSGESYFKRKVKSIYLHTVRYVQLFFMFPSHVAREYWSVLCRGVSAVWRDKVEK
jgi:hypothetical protein